MKLVWITSPILLLRESRFLGMGKLTPPSIHDTPLGCWQLVRGHWNSGSRERKRTRSYLHSAPRTFHFTSNNRMANPWFACGKRTKKVFCPVAMSRVLHVRGNLSYAPLMHKIWPTSKNMKRHVISSSLCKNFEYFNWEIDTRSFVESLGGS